MCADALQNGGVIHIFDSGHLVSQELVHRAGGLVAFNNLSFNLTVNNPVKRTRSSGLSRDVLCLHRPCLRKRPASPGRCSFRWQRLRQDSQCRGTGTAGPGKGLFVIAVTALDYSSKLVSEHPSGKRLYEAADLVLSNGAPYGDGMLNVEGLDYPVCPASGIGAAVVMWAVVAGLIEEMLGRGLQPTVFPSVNRPEGPAGQPGGGHRPSKGVLMDYLEIVIQLLQEIRHPGEVVEHPPKAVADAIEQGHLVYVFGARTPASWHKRLFTALAVWFRSTRSLRLD